MKTRGKAILISSIAGLVLLLSCPVAISAYLLCSPSVYDETFYGEFIPMEKKLHECEKKKIIFIGNSAVPFSIDTALLDEELDYAGLSDYQAINYGLYGSIGTKAMMMTALPDISKGDIVIFTPEYQAQSMSTYFSGKEMLYALDGNMSLISRLDNDSKKNCIGALNDFLSERHEAEKEKPVGSGIYSSSSFDDNCDLTQYERESNILSMHYDPNSMIDLSEDIASEDFIDYVKEFRSSVVNKGASIYYFPSVMNKSAIADTDNETVKNFGLRMENTLSMQMLSNPSESILDEEWFYDTNFHLNSYGMKKHTLDMAYSIKNILLNTKANKNAYPDKPVIEEESEEKKESDYLEGDVDCFEYEANDKGYTITGLSEKGKEKTSLVLPYEYDGKTVTEFSKEAFQNSTALEELTIQTNISMIHDYSFDGSSLSKLTLTHTKPAELSIGYHLLENCEAKIYVAKSSYSAFVNDYTWGYYASYIETY